MPIIEMIHQDDQFVAYRYGTVSPVPLGAAFQPGITMPEYTPHIDLDAAPKNIGNLPGVARSEYGATVDGGVTQLGAAMTISNTNFTNTVVDVRANITFNNCRFTLTSYTPADSIGALVRLLNGTGLTNVVFNDCEFHVRCQRVMNVISGRNTTFNRCVMTGGVDGISLSPAGGAPQSYGVKVNDCWIGDHAWWHWSTTGVVHPSDTETHNDGIQVATALGTEVNNTFFGIWPSEFVGTGTPGSGSETNPSSSEPYITTQATMDGWRTTYLNRITRNDQSFGGVGRKSTTGGSWSGIMLNQTNVTADHCWFSGGTVHINAVDSILSGKTVGSFTRNTHWNDMTAGHSLTTTAKGTAVYTRSDSTVTIPTSGTQKNVWFDGVTLIPTNM